MDPGWKPITETESSRQNMRRDEHTGSPFIRVFKGEGQAVVNCCNLDAGVWTALWPLCILQRGERGSETSPPTTGLDIDHCPKAWLIGQRDDNICSFINARQIMIDDSESDSAVVAATSKVTEAVIVPDQQNPSYCPCMWAPCVSCVSTQVCLFKLFYFLIYPHLLSIRFSSLSRLLILDQPVVIPSIWRG